MAEIKIAGKLTIKDWIDLVGGIEEDKVTIDYKSDEKWSLAFYFFEERIRTRYLNPIKAILEMGDNLGEGFAIVNLQCSLIETIESFINGCIPEYDKIKNKLFWKRKGKIVFHSNKSIFKSFFENRTPFNNSTPKINGNHFYDYVRCPILHETQTKNNWKIKKGIKDGTAFEEKDRFKIIYRENFQIDLETLIENYKISIVNGDDFDGISACELRENFISKFNHICYASRF